MTNIEKIALEEVGQVKRDPASDLIGWLKSINLSPIRVASVVDLAEARQKGFTRGIGTTLRMI